LQFRNLTPEELMITPHYQLNPALTPKLSESILSLLTQAGNSNPLWTADRMLRALRSSSVVLCAWHEKQLIGFARVITDYAWFAYLSQLAVKPEFQRQGIGRELVNRIRHEIGEEPALQVHAADNAASFYESTGFKPYANVYRLPRKK
jgi:ribosomal protein S18 acetylase RimI-like enzyme